MKNAFWPVVLILAVGAYAYFQLCGSAGSR